MTNIDKVNEYIDEKIKYLQENIVTDGVHNIPINDQVIQLLRDIKLHNDTITLSRDVADFTHKKKLCWHDYEQIDEWENHLPNCQIFVTQYACKKCGKLKTHERAWHSGR